MPENHLTNFVCVRCQANHPPDIDSGICPACGGNLDARYDYPAIAKEISLKRLKDDPGRSIWRYAPFLPTRLSQSPCPLPVGLTPLTEAPRLGERLGLKNLLVKNDSLNPSGSFKDRASLMVLAHCMETGQAHICAASTGNAGTSMACMAAAAGRRATIFVPASAPRAKIAQLAIFGARLFLVEGDYRSAFELCRDVSRRMGWFNRNTGTTPYTREGKKTVAFEIWEQMNGVCPDAVVVPVGDGNIISGAYKGFFDLQQAGMIGKIPRIIGVQAEHSAAIAAAFHGDGVIRRVAAKTVADSISAAFPSDGEAAMAAARNSGGTFVTVSDEQILDGMKALAATEGIFAEPSGAAGVAGIQALLDQGSLHPDDWVALIVTGSGLKDIDAVFSVTAVPEPVPPDPDAIIALLKEDA